jgi:3D (Asp-Asp-Asp) domain-containing protein
LSFAAIGALLLAAPAVGGADPSPTASSLRASDAQLVAKSRAAVLDLYSLDQRFGAAQARLATLRIQTALLRAEQTSLARELSIARRGVARAQSQLGASLRILYEQGSVEPIEIVLGARSLDDALAGLDNLRRASGQSDDVLQQVKAARASIIASQKALASRGRALAQATAEARATTASLAQTETARSAYIGSLARQRRLNENQIDSVVAQARAAHLRSVGLARSIGTSHTRSPAARSAAEAGNAMPPSAPGARPITVTATGYSMGGRTSAGLRAGWGVAAVDPSLIPLGSHLTVPGYGEAVAADTGGSVAGATIDLWFPSAAQANAWGRRIVTVVVH